MAENDTVKKRLISFIKYLNISQGKFETKCGLANGYVNNIRCSITPQKLQLIALQYPELNTGWLITGKGEMLNSESAESKGVTADTENNSKLIPFYDVDSTGGFQGPVSSSSESARVKGYISTGSWFDCRETAAIKHYGDSMTEYPNGCILAVREVLDINLLIPGRNYVIETDEYRVTKRYQLGSTSDTIALYSSNQEKYDDGRLVYEPFEILKSDIRRIFSILGYIVNQSSEAKLVTL